MGSVNATALLGLIKAAGQAATGSEFELANFIVREEHHLGASGSKLLFIAALMVNGSGSELIADFVIKFPAARSDFRFSRSSFREEAFYTHFAQTLPFKTPAFLGSWPSPEGKMIALNVVQHTSPSVVATWNRNHLMGLLAEHVHAQMQWITGECEVVAALEPLESQQPDDGYIESICSTLSSTGFSIDGVAPWEYFPASLQKLTFDVAVTRTISHGDFTARNVLVDIRNQRHTIDWQHLCLGPDLYDVVTFACESQDVMQHCGVSFTEVVQYHYNLTRPSHDFEVHYRIALQCVLHRFWYKVVPQLAETLTTDSSLSAPGALEYFRAWMKLFRLAHAGIVGDWTLRALQKQLTVPSISTLITRPPTILCVTSDGPLFHTDDLTGQLNLIHFPASVCSSSDQVAEHILSQGVELVLCIRCCDEITANCASGAMNSGVLFLSSDVELCTEELWTHVLKRVEISRTAYHDAGKVTIVIPTFDRQETLLDAVQSAVNQDYPDIEVVVVDDGSTYDVHGFLNDKFQSVRVLTLSKNSGKSAALNKALHTTESSFISILDDDDVALEWKTAYQVRQLVNYPDAAMSYSGWIDFTESRECVKAEAIHLALSFAPKDQLLRFIENTFISSPTVLARRAMFEAVGNFSLELYRAQQYEYWLRCLVSHTSIAFRAPTLLFRVHSRARGPKIDRFRASDRNFKRTEYEKLAFRSLSARLATLIPDANVAKRLGFSVALAKRGLLNEAHTILQCCSLSSEITNEADIDGYLDDLTATAICASDWQLLSTVYRLRSKHLGRSNALGLFNADEFTTIGQISDWNAEVRTARPSTRPGMLNLKGGPSCSAADFGNVCNQLTQALKTFDDIAHVFLIQQDNSRSLRFEAYILCVFTSNLHWGMQPNQLSCCDLHLFCHRLMTETPRPEVVRCGSSLVARLRGLVTTTRCAAS